MALCKAPTPPHPTSPPLHALRVQSNTIKHACDMSLTSSQFHSDHKLTDIAPTPRNPFDNVLPFTHTLRHGFGPVRKV